MKQKVQGRLTNIGRNLYKDHAGRIYIYDKKKQLAYTLDKNDQLIFQLYRCRLIIPITIGFLIHNYTLNTVLAVLIGLLLFAALQILYHYNFLPKLSMTNRFEPPKKESYVQKISNNDASVLMRRLIGALIIGCIFIWNLFEMKVTLSDFQAIYDWNRLLMILLSVGMIVATFTSSLIYIKVLMQKKRKVNL